MATLLTTTELRSMSAADLRTEIAEQERVLAHLKHQVGAQSEKDTAKVRRVRRAIARMHTVLAQKPKSSTVAAPATSPKAK